MNNDKEKGIYTKYVVKKLIDPTGKHKYCDYFVLDWNHDKFAIPAMIAYANACKNEFPELAADIEKKVQKYRQPEVIDTCEECHKAIVEDDDYRTDAAGFTFCKDCYDSLPDNAKINQLL